MMAPPGPEAPPPPDIMGGTPPLGLDPSLPPAPMGFPSTDPGSMAQAIMAALQQAAASDHDALSAQQQMAAGAALQSPLVQAMLGGPPSPQAAMAMRLGGGPPPALPEGMDY